MIAVMKANKSFNGLFLCFFLIFFAALWLTYGKIIITVIIQSFSLLIMFWILLKYRCFKALLIFCHCRALFRSVLFLKIIVNDVLYCLSTVNLSRHNYFLANKNLLFYWCLFVYIIKRTVHGGLKIWILLSRGKDNVLVTCCARS